MIAAHQTMLAPQEAPLGSVAFSGDWDSCLTHSGGTDTVPTAFTFSAWVKTASAPTHGAYIKIGRKQTYPSGVIQNGSGVGVGFGSSRFDPTYTGSNLVALAESIAWKNSSAQSGIGAWHHWTFTVDNLSFAAYKDGASIYSTTFTNLYRYAPCDISIGGCRGGNASGDSNRFLACNMTRSAFWNRALSASEVAQDYADGKNAPTTTSGLEHFWPMSSADNYLADAVGYLFDRVSGQLFGNAGTGAFTIGPDKT